MNALQNVLNDQRLFHHLLLKQRERCQIFEQLIFKGQLK
jgi:hypothetical protein